MGHDYHQGMPGYTERQLLHAGCAECDERAASPGAGIQHLDPIRFAQAWHRASQWKAGNSPIPDLDPAEKVMLGTLWAVQIQLESRGFPIGIVPENWALRNMKGYFTE